MNSEVINVITGVIIPVYCLWRASKDRQVVMDHTEAAIGDCKAFVKECLLRENDKQLEKIKDFFTYEYRNDDAIEKVEHIITLPKQSDNSMIILNAYLESKNFYRNVLTNLPSE